MKIVCITGMRGCGKTVFGEVAKEMGYKVHEMSDIVRDMMKNENIMIDNRNIREYAKSIRERYGKNIVAVKMVEKIMREDMNLPLIVIVGIRGMYEIREFKEAFGNDNVILIAIHSPPKVRYERVMERTNKIDDPKTYEEFLWAEEMELGYGISKAIALADIMIINNSGIEEYIQVCKKLLGGLAGGG
ncbi:MAG: AAA family ATPase [Candidatus Micrarchaeia archaeon]